MKTIQLQPLSNPITKAVKIPPSKSYTNRALLLAALSQKKTKIINPLISDDTKAMVDCLKIMETSKGVQKLDADLSGTTIRFMLALSTISKGTQILYGKEGLNKRPIGDLVSGLKQLGAKIEYLKREGFPPVKVSSSKLNPGTVKINGSVSSQFISAILMIAPLIGEVKIEIEGDLISKPYVDMTIDTMEKFGVKVIKEDNKFIVPGSQKYNADKFAVESDLSSTSYFAAIAVLTKSTIALKGINLKSKQADVEFLKILESMGNKLISGKDGLTIVGKNIRPVNVNMVNCPDQIQTLAVLTAFCKGITKITGISSLRVKETDRIMALTNELKKMGIKTSTTENALTIRGGNPKAAQIETYGDHRMAMAFAVAGSKLSGMEIIDPDVVNKTFPRFWKTLNSIGVKTKIVNSKNIVLIGMRGSGKTTVAKLLSQKLNKQYVELDELIAKRVGLTIPKIVEKYGWDFFRNKESEIVKEVSSNNSKIISTGGGIVIRPQNIDALKKNGIFVLLDASLETLIKRVGKNPNRPVLTNKKTLRKEAEEILKQRDQLYRKAADEIIDTDFLNPDEAVDKIIIRLEGAL